MKNYFALLMISLFIFNLAVDQSAFAAIDKSAHKKIVQSISAHADRGKSARPQAAEGESVSTDKKGVITTSANDAIAWKNGHQGDKSGVAQSMGIDFKQAEGRNHQKGSRR